MDGGLKLATRFSNFETCCAAIFPVQIVFIFRRRKPQATNVAPKSRPGGFSPPHDGHQSMHEAHSLRYFVGGQPAQRRHGEQKQLSESKFDHKSHKTLRMFCARLRVGIFPREAFRSGRALSNPSIGVLRTGIAPSRVISRFSRGGRPHVPLECDS